MLREILLALCIIPLEVLVGAHVMIIPTLVTTVNPSIRDIRDGISRLERVNAIPHEHPPVIRNSLGIETMLRIDAQYT